MLFVVHYLPCLVVITLLCVPLLMILPLVPLLLLINSPLVECTSSFFVISIFGLTRCERELGGLIVAVIVQSARQDYSTFRSGYGSDPARIAQILPRVNFTGSLDDVGI